MSWCRDVGCIHFPALGDVLLVLIGPLEKAGDAQAMDKGFHRHGNLFCRRSLVDV